MIAVKEIGKNACAAKREAARLSTGKKNEVLLKAAAMLREYAPQIIAANGKDMEAAKTNGMPASLQDRLALNEKRIDGIASGMEEVAALADPVGEVLSMKKRPNGLLIGKKRVPLGVVAVIYEARPNVTADVFALCFKTGNASILKGGRDAAHSNKAIADVLRLALEASGLNPDLVQLMEDNSREASGQLMKMNEYVDVLIPRGGAGLIASVVANATVPVIETGTGNCHVYVDETADLNMAADIIINGKTQRIGVCNAVESILVHESVVEELMPVLTARLAEHHVEMRADEILLPYIEGGVAATEDDWGREYLDYIVSMKAVKSVDEAIDHINRYNTGHSEAIVTNRYDHAQQFLEEVDAAAVYVNASTRFTDGNEFGLGAEIGISTQKLHARGPMGLEELTTTKYIVYGNGQIRP
ncbi:MAG: glutamate-5-semialdehyde dehydrogenase [Erysipelotrichaceae bacterium]|nr:glutamate-5-semialdehyde dehydrogenase [Erysipelotrichaceae bacterium]